MFNGFESFFQEGGFPGGAGGGDQGPIDNEALYKELGVEKDATPAQIKKAYRKAAMKHHPDRGGDTAKFQACQKAYEVLSDPKKRQMYDKYGEKGIQGAAAEHAHGGGMEDILAQMFGGGGGGRRGPQRGRDVGVRFPCTLEELFNGADKVLDWKRQDLCDSCNGQGGPPEAKASCSTCDGRGVVLRVIRMGNMIQQERRKCGTCRGQGYRMKESLRCKKCKGVGIRQITKKIKFAISPGMEDQEKIKLAQEGDRVSTDMIPGDVYVILQLKPHASFKRAADHLVYEKKITLLESLCGFEFYVKHLDGRVLKMKSEPNTVYAPGSLKLVSDEGMPTRRNPNFKGNLVIKFDVEFPETLNLDKDTRNVLKNLLPNSLEEDELKSNAGGKKKGGKKKPKMYKDAIEVRLEKITKKQFVQMSQQSSKGRHAHDEDEQDGQPQCHVQ